MYTEFQEKSLYIRKRSVIPKYFGSERFSLMYKLFSWNSEHIFFVRLAAPCMFVSISGVHHFLNTPHVQVRFQYTFTLLSSVKHGQYFFDYDPRLIQWDCMDCLTLLSYIKMNCYLQVLFFKQALRSAKALNWIVNTLLDNGFGSKESAPVIGK